MRWLPGDRARRLVTLAAVFTAAFASMATSPPEESVRTRAAGPRVELSVEEPEMTVPVEIVPNAEAEPALQKRSIVFVDPVWSDSTAGRPAESQAVSSTVPNVRDVLELTALDAAGGTLATAMGRHLTCDVEGCADVASIRFRLVDPSGGRVVLNWDFEADFFFGEGEVPADAEVAVEFGEADPGVTRVVAQGGLSYAFGRTRYGFGAVRIQIHSPHAVPPDAELSFEPLHAAQGDFLHGPEQVYEVREQVAVRLQPPKRCLTGPCDWSLLLTGNETQWQLVAKPELNIDAGVAQVTPIELESPTVSGQLQLEPGSESGLTVLVEVDRPAVAGPDFDVLGPLASVELRLAWEDPDLYLRTPEFGELDNDRGARVVYRALDLECDEQTCRATAETPVFFLQEDASGTVSWEARAFVPYLITGRVPGGREVRIEVQQ